MNCLDTYALIEIIRGNENYKQSLEVLKNRGYLVNLIPQGKTILNELY